jgi:photosystem II stability/assembly factor-like uncharacterized protein
MKKLLLIGCLLMLFQQAYQLNAQTIGWTQLSFVPSNGLNAVHCINKDTVVAVGDNGYIIRTTDGGIHWDSIPSNTLNTLYKVTFLNDAIGYACGTKGTVLKTDNGGQSWTNIGINSNLDFLSMSFINADTGWVAGGKIETILNLAGNKGVLAKTTNGGASWFVDSSYNKTISSVFFINNDTGYISLNVDTNTIAIGNLAQLCQTINGGNSFNISKQDTLLNMGYYTDIHFLNSKTGYYVSCAVPNNNNTQGVYKTEDYGQTWSNIHQQWSIRHSYIVDSCIFYVCYSDMPGSGAYGKDNCLENVIQSPWFTGMHLIDKDYGFCVGSEIYKRGIVQSINKWTTQKNIVYPNPTSNKISLDFGNIEKLSEISIYDMFGKLVFEKSHLGNNSDEEIDLSAQPNGLYYLIIKDENKIIHNAKLIKI